MTELEKFEQEYPHVLRSQYAKLCKEEMDKLKEENKRLNNHKNNAIRIINYYVNRLIEVNNENTTD